MKTGRLFNYYNVGHLRVTTENAVTPKDHAANSIHICVSWQYLRKLAMRYIADIDGDYRVVLTQVSDLRWCMQIFGPKTARYDNLYDSEGDAKADASIFAKFVLARWAVKVPDELTWTSSEF